MPIIKRRTKIVSVRLLAEEYTQLLQLCHSRGARSVSDLARDAMLGVTSPSSQLEGQVIEMDARLVALRKEVAKLSRLLGA